MKKFILFLIFSFGCAFFLVSCKKKEEKNNGLKIVTTDFVQYDFVKHITKDVLDVNFSVLIPPGVDVHSFDPSPKDMLKIKKADLFICGGGEDEKWVEKILKSTQKEKKSFVSLVELIKQKRNEKKELLKKDSHVWTSLKNCVLILKQLTEKICEIDQKNKAKYLKNMENYIKEFKEINSDFLEFLKNKKRDLVVFADGFSFLHFFNDFNLKYSAVNLNCSCEDAEINSSDVLKIIKIIKQEKVPVVLKHEKNKTKVAKTIEEQTGVKVKTIFSFHSYSKEDLEENDVFLNRFKQNIKTLKEALS